MEVKRYVRQAEALGEGPDLGQDSDLESTVGEQDLRVVLGVDRDHGVVPVDGRERHRQRVLDIPEDSPTEVDVVLDESHSAVSRPAPLRVEPDNILVVGVRVGREIPLDEVSRLVRLEAEEDVNPVDVSGVESDRVPRLGRRVPELEEVVGHLRGSSHLARPLQSEDEQVEDESVVLEDERRELETSDHSKVVDMRHILVRQDRVVLGRNVVGQVVVEDESKQSVEERDVNLLVDLRQDRFHHDVGLTVARLPDIGEVVDSLGHLVDEEGRGLGVGGLDPGGEETSLVGLEEQELVEIGVGDLLDGLNVVARDELIVRVEELDSGLLERSLGEQQSFNSREALVRVVVGLLDERELLSLRGVESTLDRVGLLELLEGKDEQLGVVLVRERREGDRSKLSALEPVDDRSVDGDGLLG